MTRTFALGLAVVLLAAGLRFHRLDAQSFWNDEGNSARLAERSVRLILEGAAGDIHPPGYYLALKVWRAASGDSEFALRSLSVLAGAVLVALVYRLGRAWSDRRAALAAALLAAVNPFLIYYSQEARMYMSATALAAASFLLFTALLRASRPAPPPSTRPPSTLQPPPTGYWLLATGSRPPSASTPTTPSPSSSSRRTWPRWAPWPFTAARTRCVASRPGSAGRPWCWRCTCRGCRSRCGR